MTIVFYIAAAVAIISTIMVITRVNIVHSLLYLVVSLLSVALVFYTLGAPFIAALEAIVYAGAIIVLFVFVVMLLNLGKGSEEQERRWTSSVGWAGPLGLTAILAFEFAFVMWRPLGEAKGIVVGPREVGLALYGPYLLGVELASMLLLAGLVGAYHIAHRGQKPSR